MRKIKWLLKAVAFSLSVILVIQILPLSSLAAELNNRKYLEQEALNNSKEYTSDIIEEVVELRGEYTKHFRREDGSYIAAVYSEPIHYQKDGEWKSISNELKAYNNTDPTSKLSGAKYTVTETSTPLTFPENINTGKITISKNGNTISFGAKGSSNVASVATLSDSKELVSASIESVQTETLTVDESQAKLIADTESSALTYSDAFNNASLEYEISSSVVKESIVVNKRSDSYRYEFSIDFGNFIPICDELTGGIYIYETMGSVEPVMAITPPYMFDANGEKSEDVTMQLVPNQNDYTLIVEADADWINSIFRKFPVIIDPTFDLDIAKKNVDDIHVNQNKPNKSYKLDYQLEVGRNNNNLFRTYIKYALPELPDCSIVTDAKLTLVQNWSRDFDATDIYLNVYQCQSEWDFSTITWNTQPIQNLSTATIVDYTNFVGGMSAEYNLNITKIVKDWYENGENYGLMLALSDESVEEKTSFYATRNIVSSYPSLTVNYVNNTGVEDYWDYETISLGKSGTAYVNLYNGELTYIHNDVTTNGLVMPVAVSHIYNMSERSASGTFNGMNFGKRFKLNVMEQIEECDIDGYPYKYIDGDGTVHFFKETDTANVYAYEFDSGVTLEIGSSGNSTLTFADGSAKYFYDGFLNGASDTNGNHSTFYFDTKLIEVTDGGSLGITFGYDANKRLIRVGDPADRLTNYTYNSDGMLTAITYPDGTSTQYTYNENLLLSQITTSTNARVTFEYKETAETYKVAKVTLYGENNSNNSEWIEFDYRTNDTLTRNSNGDEMAYAFDFSGRAVNKTLNDKTVMTAEYNSSGNSMNSLSRVSNAFEATTNRFGQKFPGETYEWSESHTPVSGGYAASYSAKYLHSEKSMRVSRTQKGTSYIHYSDYLGTDNLPQSYTVSAYVNIQDTLAEGGAFLRVVATNSETGDISQEQSFPIATTNNEWRLLTVTIAVPANTTHLRIECGLSEAVGIMYVDSLWAEEDEVVNRYNYLKSPKISPYEIHWLGVPAVGMEVAVENDGNAVIRIEGDPNKERYVHQYFNVKGKAGDSIIFGGSARALCSSSGNSGRRFFGIRVVVSYSGGEEKAYDLPFDPTVYNTMQTKVSGIVAEGDYYEVDVQLHYDYEVNSADFDNLFLFRDHFGTNYTYNEEGNLTRAENDNGYAVDYVYTNNDITRVTQTYKNEVIETGIFAYDANHNLLSSTDTNGITTSYVYNIDGMPTSVTVSNSAGQSATTSYEYGANSHYISEVTDPSGAVTQYIYDNGLYRLGLITAVIDPNGNRTNYTYDPDNDNLLSVSNPSAGLEVPQTNFSYASGRVASISNSDIEYSMSYDSFGRSTETKLEDNSLISYSYNDKELLNGAVYGNGDTVSYTYTEDHQISTEIYNGTAAYKYFYNSEGQLAKIKDFENETEWVYHYDLAGRLISSESSGGFYSQNDYDEKGNANKVTVVNGNATVLSQEYAYDEENRPSSVTIGSMANSPVQSYAYDSFGRTQSITSTYDGTNTISNSYTYLTNGENQTGRVGSVSYAKTTAEGTQNILPTLSYAYDANGNITNVYENGVQKVKYYYDGLNRLIREDNSYLDKTVSYVYDKNGDIISKSEYELTDSQTLGTAVSTVSYQYSDSRHPNGLTAYGNDTVTYDANGNPLTYRGYTMNWEKGRQLESMTDGTNTLSFKYDSSGIRTSKTVNGTQTKYTYIGTTLVSQKTGNEVINFAYSAGGSPYGFTYNGTSYFYLLNLQGDVIGIYDGNGNIVVQYLYDSWGRLISIAGSLADTIGVKNPLRYRGYYYDTETGLYYLQSRYYDPETCRFINADSLLVAGDYLQGTNMFAYCLNNPVMYVDYEGYSTTVAIGTASAAALLAKAGTIGATNAWNVAGWVLLGATVVGTAALVGYTVYQSSKSTTKTLADTKAKIPTNDVYYLAFINSKNELVKKGKGMSFVKALAALGISGATNTLTKIYKYNKGKSSDAQRKAESYGANQWGIYTHDQSAAKALAVVFGYNKKPEYHGPGTYGHYHDSERAFHIWFGGKLQ